MGGDRGLARAALLLGDGDDSAGHGQILLRTRILRADRGLPPLLHRNIATSMRRAPAWRCVFPTHGQTGGRCAHFRLPCRSTTRCRRCARRCARAPNAVLVAPPGAGKTTRVPLALLDEPWVGGRQHHRAGAAPPRRPRRGRADGLDPRRARSARPSASRAARARRSRPRTRIEVVTEGVFTRMILDDPGARRRRRGAVRRVPRAQPRRRPRPRPRARRPGAACARTCASWYVRDARRRPRRAACSATRPVIESEGRAFPVETRYLGRDPRRRIEDAVAAPSCAALAREARLDPRLPARPGRDPPRRALLRRAPARPGVDIAPLYGALDRARAGPRHRARRRPGRRKVVLATSIAETSLTIEGVRVVIDSRPRPRAALRARHRPDAAGDRARLPRRRRPAPRPRRAHRAGRLLPPVGRGGDRRARRLRPAGDPRRRPRAPAPRLRRLGRRAIPATPRLRSTRRPAPALAEARGLLRGPRARSTATAPDRPRPRACRLAAAAAPGPHGA